MMKSISACCFTRSCKTETGRRNVSVRHRAAGSPCSGWLAGWLGGWRELVGARGGAIALACKPAAELQACKLFKPERRTTFEQHSKPCFRVIVHYFVVIKTARAEFLAFAPSSCPHISAAVLRRRTLQACDFRRVGGARLLLREKQRHFNAPSGLGTRGMAAVKLFRSIEVRRMEAGWKRER